ncbi:MAG: VOC family protein [Myxococcota bacterium]|nr:VOC family protein [Myxococcota bacterium]
MSAPVGATFAATKLVVHDLERMATFYCNVYGFEQTGRIQADIAGEPIDEIFLGKDGETAGGLILMKYVDRAAPETGEAILVFTTQDIDALFDSVRAAGGGVYLAPYQSEATPYKAGFTLDPEGHLIENVEIPA